MKKIFSLILTLGMFSFVSCVEDEGAFSTDGKTPLEAPASYEAEADLSSATVSWTPVENAGMYYYEVRNSEKLVVKKGETTTPSVSIGGLRHSSTYTVYVKAIPTADVVAKYCASAYLQFEVSTAVKPERHWAWNQPATIWFSDDKAFLSRDAIFGLDADSGNYVVEAWCGVEGFDLEFSLENQNTGDANYGEQVESNNGTAWSMFPIQGGPQFKELAGWELRLYHGLGGTTNDYVSWDNAAYANGCFYKTNNEKGGSARQWCFGPNGDWTYWQLEYGDGKGDAVDVEPEPWTPDPDATEDWEAVGETMIGEETIYANIYYDAAEKSYYVENWLGAENADLVFSRDAETGEWKIDYKESSSYAADCPKDGGHGFYGKDGVYWLYEEESESGLEGTPAEGHIWITLTTPAGEELEYNLVWPATLYVWTIEGSYYSGKYDTALPASLSYNDKKDNYTLNFPHYGNASVVFTFDAEGKVVSAQGLSGVDGDYWRSISYGDGDWIYFAMPLITFDLAGGSITFGQTDQSGVGSWADTFTWKVLGADDLVGTYEQYTTGYWWNGPANQWDLLVWDNDVTITKVDVKTVKISGLIDCEDELEAVVDGLAGTITIAAGQPFQGGAYHVSAYGSEGDIVGTIDGDTINFASWSVHNDGHSLYWDNMPTTLTKK